MTRVDVEVVDVEDAAASEVSGRDESSRTVDDCGNDLVLWVSFQSLSTSSAQSHTEANKRFRIDPLLDHRLSPVHEARC